MGGLENLLKQVNVGKLKMSNGMTYEQMLKSEMNRFWGILENNFQIAYYSYTPKVYKRTGQILNSFLPRDEIELNMINKTIQMRLIVMDNAWHDSMFDDWEGANIIYLLNYGYNVSSGYHKNIENFGYREGYHFIEQSIAEFESSSKYGVKVNYKPPKTIYS